SNASPNNLPRRHFVATVAAGAMARLQPVRASAQPLTSLIKRQIMQNSAEWSTAVTRVPIKQIEKLWTETPVGQKPALDWEKNQAASADCAALRTSFDGNSFVMSANVLKRYAAINRFAIARQPR